MRVNLFVRSWITHLPVVLILCAIIQLVSGCVNPSVSQQSLVVKVFSTVEMQIETPRFLQKPLITVVTTENRSTGFLVYFKGRYFCITAAHAVSGEELAHCEGKVVARNRRGCLISRLAVRPTRVIVKGESDIAALEISKEDAERMRANIFMLSKRGFSLFGRDCETPSLSQSYNTYGFSSNSVSPNSRVNVSATEIFETYFALGHESPPGFSGGPVLTSEGKLVGMVSRSTAASGQTRCVRVDEIIKCLPDK